jgi:hypothetical protein
MASGLSLEERAEVRRRYADAVPTDAETWAALNRSLSIDPLLDPVSPAAAGRAQPAHGAASPQDAGTPFLAWCEALRTPGHWNPAADKLVAPLLPGLPGWPTGKVFELVDMDSPATPLVRTPGSLDERDVVRVWRSTDGFCSAKAVEDESTPLITHRGGDGFLGALVQELALNGVGQAIHDAAGKTQGTTKVEQFRHILADHLPTVPLLIEATRKLVLRETVTTDPVAGPAPLDAVSQRGLDTLVGWIENSNWASEAGDIAPQLITRLPGWPAHLTLEIHQPDAAPIVYGKTQRGQAPVTLWRENDHYSALVDGLPVQVPADGNCFYRAVVEAINPEDARALTLATDRNQQAERLRMALADFVRGHPEFVSQWVDLRDIAVSPSDPQVSSPVPSSHLEALIPARSSSAEKSKALLDELLALSERNRIQNPDMPALTPKMIETSAAKHGFSAVTVSGWIALYGKLKLTGHAIQQIWEKKQLGGIFERPDANLLLSLQARAKDKKNPLPLGNEYITALSRLRNISINYLRSLIRKDGSFTRTGQEIVDQAMGGPVGVRSKSVTPQMLKDLQVRHREQGRLNLKHEADRLHVSFGTLRKLIYSDGILSDRGESVVASRRKVFERITTDVMLETQERVRAGEQLKDICTEKDLAYSTMRKRINQHGDLTPDGENIFHREESRTKNTKKNNITPKILLELQKTAANGALSLSRIFKYSKEKNVSFGALKTYFYLDGRFTEYGKAFLKRHRPAIPAHVAAAAQVSDIARQTQALLDQGQTEEARKLAQPLLQSVLRAQLNSPWTAGRTEMNGQEAAAMNAVNAGYMDLLKILVGKDLLGARQVFDQVFGAGESVGESGSEEAPYHIHIASRISSADQPGGAAAPQLAQAMTQLLRELADKLERTEGPDARSRMRRDLLRAYPQQVSVLNKVHYRKYQDFISRAVLAGGMRNPHRASLIAARGLSQACLLPGPDEGLSAKRAHKFKDLAQRGARLTPGELPASRIDLGQVRQDLDPLDLEAKYTARVAKRARLDEEAQARRAAEKLEKTALTDLQAAIRREVDAQWAPLARQTRKRHAPGAWGILAPVDAAVHAKEAASVSTTAPEPLVDAVRDALMVTPQGKTMVQKLVESGEKYSREAHPQFHAVLQRIAAANAETTQENYAQRIRQNAACTIAALEAHDMAAQAQRAAERAASEQQQTLDVQARGQSQPAGPEAWARAGGSGRFTRPGLASGRGWTTQVAQHVPIPSPAPLAWPTPPSTHPIGSVTAQAAGTTPKEPHRTRRDRIDLT